MLTRLSCTVTRVTCAPSTPPTLVSPSPATTKRCTTTGCSKQTCGVAWRGVACSQCGVACLLRAGHRTCARVAMSAPGVASCQWCGVACSQWRGVAWRVLSHPLNFPNIARTGCAHLFPARAPPADHCPVFFDVNPRSSKREQVPTDPRVLAPLIKGVMRLSSIMMRRIMA